MKKILVTGGAGYIGSMVCRLLLEKGYKVRVLDKLIFGGESIIELINNDNFEFIAGDTCENEDRMRATKGVDCIIHLAAIVGDPACAKNPELAKLTNLEATQALYTTANETGVKRFIFASTCSNYGKMKDPNAMVDEDSELSPVSLYAETKVAVELFLLEQKKSNVCKPVCLRFATVYGLSPRMRFDLTINEFAKDLALKRELVVFGEQFWRPYCHVQDIAIAVVSILEAPEDQVTFDVFNVGDSSENYTKKMIVEEILEILPGSTIKYVHKTEDPRDYKVSFKKIKERLGWSISKTVPAGIRQIIRVINEKVIPDPDAAKYFNS